MHRATSLLTIILIGACLQPGAGRAAQSVELHATLTPEHLGRATTIGFGFQIASTTSAVPPPLTEIGIRYPGELGIDLSGLGVANCLPGTLELYGPSGCPADSVMGYGAATAEIQIGPDIQHESAIVTVIRAPTQEGHLGLLFYADGEDPVNAQLVLPGLILPTPTPFGGRINIALPLVPSLPEAPDVALIELTSTLGPEHLTYYEHAHGKIVAYRPKGILLPETCPHGGFPFTAELGFLDGTRAVAHTSVPCPPAPRGQRSRNGR